MLDKLRRVPPGFLTVGNPDARFRSSMPRTGPERWAPGGGTVADERNPVHDLPVWAQNGRGRCTTPPAQR